tara:strand:- start:296 stop:412 length:117 start_codon:yes stop_codon:yes gene_type:complete
MVVQQLLLLQTLIEVVLAVEQVTLVVLLQLTLDLVEMV